MDKKPFFKILQFLDEQFYETKYQNGNYNYPFNVSKITFLFSNLSNYDEYLNINDYFQENADIDYLSESMLTEQYSDIEDDIKREKVCEVLY
ncbi:MAG: hypothetical protein PHC62_09820, partial [Candidatus Izemoplasmatales bacterium]|nr:hypothetical protein [Candidatus Izemoplasmatales bacterium]